MTPIRGLFAAIALGVLLVAACGSDGDATGGAPEIVEIGGDLAVPPDDRQATLAFSDDVVVLEIFGEGETRLSNDLPTTYYVAVVRQSLAGEFEPGDTITLEQEGGLFQGDLYVVEGQRPIDGAGFYVIAGRITDDGALRALPGVGVEKLESDLTSGDEAIEDWASIGMPGNGTLLAQP